MGEIVWNDAQRQIIDFREGNMIVSASAGSGKTTVMLERVMRLIERGTPIDRIVILAFNRSIAGEIRQKLYNKLSRRIESGEAENTEFLCEQLDRIHLANIVTNDSYCSQTVKEFFQYLGIDPAADILSEQEATLLYGKCYDSAEHILIESGEDWIYDLTDKFGGRESLIAQVGRIHTFAATIPDSDRWLETVVDKVYSETLSDSKAMDYLREIILHRAEYAESCVDRQEDLLSPFGLTEKGGIPVLRQFFANLMSVSDYTQIYTMINGFSYPAKVRKSGKYDIDWEEYKRYFDYAKESYESLLRLVRINPEQAAEIHRKTCLDVERLMKLYREVENVYRREKERIDKYEFSDMVQFTLKVLADPDIADGIKERYDYICIDEYQDTNYAQESMFNSISNGHNLFMVGDSKQSIYKFRLTEPKILLDKYDAYESGEEEGKTVHLDCNYRSERRIVDFVNMIFNVIMTKNTGGVDYARTDELVCGADYIELDSMPPCTIELFKEREKDRETVSLSDGVYSVMNDSSSVGESGKGVSEGRYIADKIRQIVGNARIYDVEIGGERAVKYSDIAILAKSNNETVRNILSVLQEEHIPVNIGGIAKFGELYETDILKSVFAVISNDRDDIALTAYLTSYWAGLTAQELFDIRMRHTDVEYFYEACIADRDCNGRLSEAYRYIDKLRLAASYMTLYELARHIVYDSGYDKHLLASDGGRYKMMSINVYLQSLKSLGAGVTVADYVSSSVGGELRADEDAGVDCVKAMTVHKSKGLEFPIVFLVNCVDSIVKGVGLNSPRLQLDKDMGIAINYFDSERRATVSNLIFDIFAEKNKVDEQAEAMRLFYVALTRAKNHIFITATVNAERSVKPPFKVNSFLDWIYQAADVDPRIDALLREPQVYDMTAGNMERYTFRRSDSRIPEIDRYLDFAYPHEESKKLCIKYTVTEINHIDSYEDDIRLDSVASDWTPSVDRARRGTDYHAILEHIDYDRYSVAEVESQLAEMVRSGIISDSDVQSVNAAEIAEVLAGSIIRYAAANKHYREREFMLCVRACDVMNTAVDDKILIQGAVDLIIDGDELVVVDFKKSNAATAVLRERYRKQLELYALAVSEAMGRPVDRSLLYIIGRNEVIEY